MEIDVAHNEWPDDKEVLKQVPKGNPFTVPAGYFETLTQQITSAVKLEDIKQADNGQGFTVPANYFDDLTSNIQSRIAVEELTGDKVNNFTIPQNYFEELGTQIQSRIQLEELTDASKTAFAVPDGYFDKLNAQILTRTTEEQEAKVIQLQPKHTIIRKLITSAAFKYASAACLVLIVGIAIFMKQSSKTSSEHYSTYLHKELATIPAEDIKNYLELQSDAMDTEHTLETNVSTLNNAELQKDLRDALDEQ